MEVENDNYVKGVPHRAVVVYRYLRDRSNKEGMCFPSMRLIASELHISRRTVIRAVNDLKAAGYIYTKQRLRSNGAKSTLLYYIVS